MANYTKWTNWGTTNTSPLIGLEISTSVYTATQIKVQYSFKYHKRWNYTSDQVWLNCPTYLDSYIDNKILESQIDFKAYSSTYPNIGIYTIFTGERIFDRQSTDYNVKFKLSANWNGLTWDSIKDSDAPNARIVEIDVKIDKYIQLSSPTINTDLGIIAPINSIDTSWNKIENASSYLLTIKDSNGNNLYGPKSTSNTKLTSTFSNLDSYRGRQLIAYIQAIGSSGYMDSITSSKIIATINTLPSAPSVSQSGTNINTNTSISFYVTAGSSGNTGQSASLYYSLNDSEKKEFTSPLVLNANQAKSGSNTINFYTYDGLEYSSPTTKTFSVSTTSPLSNVTINHSYINDMNGGMNSLVKESNISFSFSGSSINSVSVKARVSNSTKFSGEGVDITSSCSQNLSSQIIYVPIKNIGAIGYGQYFQLQIIINGIKSDWLTTGRKPKLPRNAESFDCVDSSSSADPGYFKNKAKISATIPYGGAEYATLSSLFLIANYSNTSKEFNISSTGSFNQEFDLSFVPQGAIVSFSIRIIDVTGYIVNSDILGSLTRTSNLSFPTQTISVSSQLIKPLSDTYDIILSHPQITITAVSYTYGIRVNGKEFGIQSNSSQNQGVTREVSFRPAAIGDLITDNKNTSYTAYFIVTAKDNYGSVASLISQSFIIDYREVPVFNTQPFKIQHDYNISGSNNYVDVPTNTNDPNFKNRAMFNTKEGIVFCLPRANDKNSDISEYQIFLTRVDFAEGQIINPGFSSQPWLNIPYESLEAGKKDASYYYYRYTATQYNKNEAFFFKTRVKDSQGNYSKEKIYDGYIIGCRTVQPKFSINLQNIERNGTTATLTYNFNLNDLGGSAKSSGWNSSFYNNYKNFERNITDYAPFIELKIEISSTNNFSEKTDASITGYSPLLNFSGTNNVSSGKGIIIYNVPSDWDKLFVRFTLIVSYTINGTLTSQPLVIPWSGDVPTVSHRAHKVGVNTNTFEKDEVLVIEPYQQAIRKVVLKGGNSAITIDLIDGTIDGAIISGGNW